MFSGVTIGILAALSVAAWIYTNTMRRTGNNTKPSAITAAIAAAITFVVVVTLVATIDSMLG